MTPFFRRGALFAHNVDIARLARDLGKEVLPGCSQDQRLEIIARALGSESHFALRKAARDPDISAWTEKQVLNLVEAEAVSRGERFPAELPANFGRTWQRQVATQFDEAVAEMPPGALSLIALVGPPGSGKTLLAQDCAARMGGVVVDIEQASRVGGFHGQRFRDGDRVLVFDQGASPGKPMDEVRGLGAKFPPDPPVLSTLSAFRKARRGKFDRIPNDDAPHVLGAGFREFLLARPGLVFAMCFASEAEARAAISRSARVQGGGGARMNWRAMHIVDLGSMERSVVQLDQK